MAAPGTSPFSCLSFCGTVPPKSLLGMGTGHRFCLTPGDILTAYPPWGYSGHPGLWAWSYPAREKGLPQAPFQPHGDGRATQKQPPSSIPSHISPIPRITRIWVGAALP